MSQIHVVMLGGTGFVGHHLLPKLSADGCRVTVLSRHCGPHRDLSVLPGVQLHQLDVYDEAALCRALKGADAVINLIGILNADRTYSFERVHVDLTRRLITACLASGVSRLHQMSALKAGQGTSQYLQTRGQAEALVKASPLCWTIYQPSVIFGEGDGLVQRFATLLRYLPLLPLARYNTRMAPTWVGDVVTFITRCVRDDYPSRQQSYELYGSQVLSLGQIVQAISTAADLHQRIVPLSDQLGYLQAMLAEWLPGKPFSRDNFRSLLEDSTGIRNAYADLNISPRALTPCLPMLLQTKR